MELRRPRAILSACRRVRERTRTPPWRQGAAPSREPARSWREPGALDFISAAEARGHRRLHDFNGPEGVAGAAILTVNIREGRRFGSREAYLDPALSREKLTVWSDTRAIQLNLRGSRCVGLTVQRAGAPAAV
jgi:choline dehydrogenase-like flavoprotein